MNTQGSQVHRAAASRRTETRRHHCSRKSKQDTKTGSGPNPLEEQHRTRNKVSSQDDELHDHQSKDRDPIERAPTDEHAKAKWNGRDNVVGTLVERQQTKIHVRNGEGRRCAQPLTERLVQARRDACTKPGVDTARGGTRADTKASWKGNTKRSAYVSTLRRARSWDC